LYRFPGAQLTIRQITFSKDFLRKLKVNGAAEKSLKKKRKSNTKELF